MVYIAGFVVHKTLRVLSCDTCINMIQIDRTLQIDSADVMEGSVDTSFVEFLDRGGLKYPTVMAVLVGYRVFCVLQALVSKEHESVFLTLRNQKSVAFAIVLEVLHADDFFQSEASGDCIACGKPSMDLATLLVPHFLNVLLNNYTQKCNDAAATHGSKKSLKRKLKTLE